MKNTTMKKAMVMVKDWAERNKKVAGDLESCFDNCLLQLNDFLVENFGKCGEWEGSDETPPTYKQKISLNKVVAKVYGWKMRIRENGAGYCFTRIAK